MLSSVYDNSFTNKFYPASHLICGVSFFIDILLARVNTRIQALFRQGFAIPLKTENGKVNTENRRNLHAKYKNDMCRNCRF